MKITKRMLQEKNACAEEVAKFAELFPEGTEITEALCMQHARTFNWRWAAQYLLSEPTYNKFEKVRTTALDECNNTIAAARAEYEKFYADIRTKYDNYRASLRAESEKPCVAAWAKFGESSAAAWVKFNKACAAAFARGWEADHAS